MFVEHVAASPNKCTHNSASYQYTLHAVMNNAFSVIFSENENRWSLKIL